MMSWMVVLEMTDCPVVRVMIVIDSIVAHKMTLFINSKLKEYFTHLPPICSYEYHCYISQQTFSVSSQSLKSELSIGITY